MQKYIHLNVNGSKPIDHDSYINNMDDLKNGLKIQYGTLAKLDESNNLKIELNNQFKSIEFSSYKLGFNYEVEKYLQDTANRIFKTIRQEIFQELVRIESWNKNEYGAMNSHNVGLTRKKDIYSIIDSLKVYNRGQLKQPITTDSKVLNNLLKGRNRLKGIKADSDYTEESINVDNTTYCDVFTISLIYNPFENNYISEIDYCLKLITLLKEEIKQLILFIKNITINDDLLKHGSKSNNELELIETLNTIVDNNFLFLPIPLKSTQNTIEPFIAESIKNSNLVIVHSDIQGEEYMVSKLIDIIKECKKENPNKYIVDTICKRENHKILFDISICCEGNIKEISEKLIYFGYEKKEGLFDKYKSSFEASSIAMYYIINNDKFPITHKVFKPKKEGKTRGELNMDDVVKSIIDYTLTPTFYFVKKLLSFNPVETIELNELLIDHNTQTINDLKIKELVETYNENTVVEGGDEIHKLGLIKKARKYINNNHLVEKELLEDNEIAFLEYIDLIQYEEVGVKMTKHFIFKRIDKKAITMNNILFRSLLETLNKNVKLREDGFVWINEHKYNYNIIEEQFLTHRDKRNNRVKTVSKNINFEKEHSIIKDIKSEEKNNTVFVIYSYSYIENKIGILTEPLTKNIIKVDINRDFIDSINNYEVKTIPKLTKRRQLYKLFKPNRNRDLSKVLLNNYIKFILKNLNREVWQYKKCSNILNSKNY